jgi:hypothetical protein
MPFALVPRARSGQAVLPPLLAEEGWGGVALRDKDQKLYPRPTSPGEQGEG